MQASTYMYFTGMQARACNFLDESRFPWHFDPLIPRDQDRQRVSISGPLCLNGALSFVSQKSDQA